MILQEVTFDGFSNIFDILFGIVGIGLIILGIYLKIKDISFRKEARIVKFLVKKVEEISDTEEGKKIVRGYNTTFEFEYEGNKKEYTMTTSKKFKEGSTKEGLYLLKNGKETVSISGEGFYLAKGGELILIVFGIVTLVVLLFEISFTILIIILLLCLALFVLFPMIVSQKSNKNKKETIYYNESNNNDYSTVNENLVRYIPKREKSKSSNVPIIIIYILLISVGLILTVFGVKNTVKSMQLKKSYSKVEGEITNVREKYQKTPEGDETSLYVTYTYYVDGISYSFEEYGGPKNGINNYKIGDVTDIYYDKNDPNTAVTKSYFNAIIEPAIGILIIFIGIFVFIEDRKQRKLYKAYVSLEEKKK